MNITTEQLWDSAKRLRACPALLDVAGAFVLLYARAVQTNPVRGKSFLLSIRPMGGFKDYIDCLNTVIVEMPTFKRYSYEPHDIELAIILHGKANKLTVPYLTALDDVFEWLSPELAWAAPTENADEFLVRVGKYWGIAKGRRASMQAVAEAIGVSRATFYYWLSGKSVPPAQKMSAYIKAFHTYIQHLTGLDPDA